MKILITRPEPDSQELILHLRQLGKQAWSLPLIEFFPGSDLCCLPYYITNLLYATDLVFILSKQAVYFADYTLKKANIPWPDYLNYYAIGYTTALAFKKASNLNINYPKNKENSEELIILTKLYEIKNKRAIICGGNSSRELLKKTLLDLDIKVCFIECYKSVRKKYDGEIEGKRLRKLGINTLVVTSGDMLEQIFYLFPKNDREEWLLKCKLLVVSERLFKIARRLGWKDIHITEKANNKHILKVLLYS
ncbi:uroporphyrinogen-III synthase [Candidatus Pantoea edessiphila]|uniref:Uroporphyrinogen-III synthase n=1 Tax=Candidatus Pantoea edessiphila TaxID=2044610 RepID=A0A2P5SXD4_9GAMM|nr:uroporphyrinogen-III synthase [Candidatus Pantoea edessiphila]MBK4775826.1 uroporphyrinogen-III synthase [Pantoea sp. Edef]PPI86984.1 uroporphyrinogen-III synthase [Candidatus Pantoea edessiphila]